MGARPFVGRRPWDRRAHDQREGRDHLFAFAGLWESWNKDGEIRSSTILTTQADDLVGGIHEQMPVILPREHYHAGLDPEPERDQVAVLLAPYPDDLKAYPVSPFTNCPGNDDSRCIEPAA